jgi:hypothetical protein
MADPAAQQDRPAERTEGPERRQRSSLRGRLCRRRLSCLRLGPGSGQALGFEPGRLPDCRRAPLRLRDPGVRRCTVSTARHRLSHRKEFPSAAARSGSFAVLFLKMPGRILNLSLGGSRIRTDERFNVGIYVRVEAEFFLHGLPFRVGGVSQPILEQNTNGVRFVDRSQRRREQLAERIAEIAEAAREPAAGLAEIVDEAGNRPLPGSRGSSIHLPVRSPLQVFLFHEHN